MRKSSVFPEGTCQRTKSDGRETALKRFYREWFYKYHIRVCSNPHGFGSKNSLKDKK